MGGFKGAGGPDPPPPRFLESSEVGGCLSLNFPLLEDYQLGQTLVLPVRNVLMGLWVAVLVSQPKVNDVHLGDGDSVVGT